MRKLFVNSSWGNDSVACVRLVHEYNLGWPTTVVYCDTGWGEPEWLERVRLGEEWARSLGFECRTLSTEGFEARVRRTGFMPTGATKSCTKYLKIHPTLRWMKEVDPEGQALCVVGKRRAESLARAHTPVFLPASMAHGGRMLWQPLAEFSDADRDAMVAKTPLELLPHRSDECNPCIFSTRADLRRVPLHKVDRIRSLEEDTGRTFFRPRAYAGAVGIDEVMRWAWSDRGKFVPNPAPSPTEDGEDGDVEEGDCESSYCGS